MDKTIWKPEFRARFCRHEAELTRLYRELYHSDMAAFDRFTAMLYSAYLARPESLKLMDRAREARKDWYKGHALVGMLLYVNAFGGTLRGVREKLSYIEDCGVNYLHLMPLLESPKGRSDGGYAVSDFRKVQPELGTMEDLAALAEDCHKRGIAVCLDFVMNHTSEDHEWARGPGPVRKPIRIGISSIRAGTSPTLTSRPCPRSSPPRPPATLPGARRRKRWS